MINEEYERNHSHYHCWEQLKHEDSDIEPETTPACGQPIEKHSQCCLCDTPLYTCSICGEKCEARDGHYDCDPIK